MATSTTKVPVTNAAWVEIASSPATGAFIQLQSGGPVRIHASDDEPDVGDITGIVLGFGGLTEMNFDALDGATIYARAIDSDTENLVVILT